jgi:hypothetical protein
MDALFNWWAPRDFLDVDVILASGRYTRDQLLELAAERNPGFSVAMFAESLSFLRRIPNRDLTSYGVTDVDIEAMRLRFADWRGRLAGSACLVVCEFSR